MCPFCWATALASCAALVVVSIVGIAGTDILSLTLASLFGGLSLLHRQDVLFVPWWCLAGLIAAATARIGHLLVRERDRLLICDIWKRAKQIAARRCPRKSVDTRDSEA